jgi:hypothetical protein
MKATDRNEYNQDVIEYGRKRKAEETKEKTKEKVGGIIGK